MIEYSFFLSVVGLVISVLISYSKWMYHHFSLAIGGPKRWHIRAFSTRKTDTGLKIYWRCENRKCKQFLFFLYKSHFDQISTKISTLFDKFSTKCRSRPNVVVGEKSYRPNVAFNQTSFRRNIFRPKVMDPSLAGKGLI